MDCSDTGTSKSAVREDRFEHELIGSLAIGREALGDGFAYAKQLTLTPPKGWDWIDATRARETAVGGAVSIMKAMAELTLATAKLRGEFRNIHDVTHHTAEPAKAEGPASRSQQGGEG